MTMLPCGGSSARAISNRPHEVAFNSVPLTKPRVTVALRPVSEPTLHEVAMLAATHLRRIVDALAKMGSWSNLDAGPVLTLPCNEERRSARWFSGGLPRGPRSSLDLRSYAIV